MPGVVKKTISLPVKLAKEAEEMAGMSLIVENFRMLEGEICDHQR